MAGGPDWSARAGGGRSPRRHVLRRPVWTPPRPPCAAPLKGGGSCLNLQRWPADTASVSASPFLFAANRSGSELSAFEAGEECWPGHSPPFQGGILPLPTSGFLFLRPPWRALPEGPTCCRWRPGQALWRACSPWFLSPDTVTDCDVCRGSPEVLRQWDPSISPVQCPAKLTRGPDKGRAWQRLSVGWVLAKLLV